MFRRLFSAKEHKEEVIEKRTYDSIEEIKLEVAQVLKDVTQVSKVKGLSHKEMTKFKGKKGNVINAFYNSTFGDEKSKAIVVRIIKEFIINNLTNKNVSSLLGLAGKSEPSKHVKFEIMMYKYKYREKHGRNALNVWLTKYGFNKPRNYKGDIDYCYISDMDLHDVYREEDIHLTHDEKRDILAILVFQSMRGIGFLDTIRDMNINGFTCGSSTSLLKAIHLNERGVFTLDKSMWVLVDNVPIHFIFMDFKDFSTLANIVEVFKKYGVTDTGTISNSYTMSTMLDNSKVFVIKPPLYEGCAIFYRKLSLPHANFNTLLSDDIDNVDVVRKLLTYIISSGVSCIFIGGKGIDKKPYTLATLDCMKNTKIHMLDYITRKYMRVLHPSISNDFIDKETVLFSITDACIETDMLLASTPYKSLVMSITATSCDNLIEKYKCICKDEEFTSAEIENELARKFTIVVQLEENSYGVVGIKSISELVPTALERKSNDIMDESFLEKPKRVNYIEHKILKYNEFENSYIMLNRLTQNTEDKIRKTLGKSTEEFDKLIYTQWGRRNEKERDSIEEAMLTYYKADENVKALLSSNNLTKEDIASVVKNLNIDGDISISIDKVEKSIDENTVDDTMVFFDFYDSFNDIDNLT